MTRARLSDRGERKGAKRREKECSKDARNGLYTYTDVYISRIIAGLMALDLPERTTQSQFLLNGCGTIDDD
jgi:hypothetical protein